MSETAIEPRKAPRQARAAATVDAILEASAHILREGGLGALNTNAVALRAGASIGSLYQYFPSKESILAELIRRRHQTMLDAIREITHDTKRKSFSKMVDQLIAAGIAHQLDDAPVSLALEYAEAILPLEKETKALNTAIATEISSALAAHGIADADTAARDVAALTRGMVDAAGLNGETNASSLTKRVTRAVTGYLRSAPRVKKA